MEYYRQWVHSIVDSLPGLAQSMSEEADRLTRLDETRYLKDNAEELLVVAKQAEMLERSQKWVYLESRQSQNSWALLWTWLRCFWG